MEILEARGFSNTLKSFGIERVVAPDLTKAKQTETTQRYKIHVEIPQNLIRYRYK